MKKFIFLFLYLFLIAGNINASTYYIDDAGDNGNSGADCDHAWATFAYAFTQMSGSDTLYVCDGTYNEHIIGAPAGSEGALTTIAAVNRFGATIDGLSSITYCPGNTEGLMELDNNYVAVDGLIIKDSYGHCLFFNSNYCKATNIIAYQAGDSKYSRPIMFFGDYNILEDSVAFGRGKYSIHASAGADYNTLRRVVARNDGGFWSGEPNAGITLYKANDTTVENCIVMDMLYSDWGVDHLGFYNHTHTVDTAKRNEHYGCIAINLPSSIFAGFMDEVDQNDNEATDDDSVYNNCVAIDIESRGFTYQHGEDDEFINNSAINCTGSGFRENGGGVDATYKNCLSYSNDSYGFINNGGTYEYFDYNGTYDNTSGGISGFSCTNCLTSDPGLLYPVRIEAESAYEGAGESGADIGANIIYRYEDGVLTETNLWPWPNEDEIKNCMCGSTELTEVGRTGDDTPDWCNTDKTLTEYIWEYLGNTIPSDIYGESTQIILENVTVNNVIIQ